MRVACSKCGLSFETLIIDQHQALKELEAKTINHVKHKHPEIFNPLADGIQNRVGILRGAGNAIVPAQAAVFIQAFLLAVEEQQFD